jgi:hypothetical protein
MIDSVIAMTILDCEVLGQRRDNVFVERMWRSINYEEVYLKLLDV